MIRAGAQVAIDREDFLALKDCWAGRCDVKVSAQAIARLKTESGGNAPQASKQVNELARAFLLDYVKHDLAGGNKAFIEYSDKQAPLRLAEEFEAILSTSPMLLRLRAGILRQLRNYTADRGATRQAVWGVWIPVGP